MKELYKQIGYLNIWENMINFGPYNEEYMGT
jgi:hypothetical protein